MEADHTPFGAFIGSAYRNAHSAASCDVDAICRVSCVGHSGDLWYNQSMKSSGDVEASRCPANSLKGAIDMTQYTTSETTREIPYGYCHCGCGEKTRIAKRNDPRDGVIKGEPSRYISGHNCRVDIMSRFWSKVNIGDPSSCWEWTGAKKDGGYGEIGYGGKTKGAHRLAYEFVNGPIPEGLFVCHTCDNPACVNPSHLFAGTQLENMSDCAEKDRMPRGRKRAFSKLSDLQVIEIRDRYSSGFVYQSELASEYGVSQSAISAIVRRVKWKHLP